MLRQVIAAQQLRAQCFSTLAQQPKRVECGVGLILPLASQPMMAHPSLARANGLRLSFRWETPHVFDEARSPACESSMQSVIKSRFCASKIGMIHRMYRTGVCGVQQPYMRICKCYYGPLLPPTRGSSQVSFQISKVTPAACICVLQYMCRNDTLSCSPPLSSLVSLKQRERDNIRRGRTVYAVGTADELRSGWGGTTRGGRVP